MSADESSYPTEADLRDALAHALARKRFRDGAKGLVPVIVAGSIEPEAVLRGMSLHALEDELYRAHQAISDALEAEQEVPPEAIATVEAYSLAAGQKRDACAAVLRRLDAEADYIGAEIARLAKLKAQRAAGRDRLRHAILAIMQAHQITKIKGETSSFSVIQNQPTVDAGSLELLPAEMIREKVTREPDKIAIRKKLEAGEVVGEARLVPGTFRLAIK